MKLTRFYTHEGIKPAVVINQQRFDCSAFFTDWDHHFFQQHGLKRLDKLLNQQLDKLPLVAENAKWAPCVARPFKTIAIGLNYRDHALETGANIPSEPVIFSKATSAIIGPYDDIVLPPHSEKTDWEVELGIIINNDAQYLSSPAEAAEYIAGFCLSHDVSERSFQKERGGQWVKGKSCDTFHPLGPYLVTADEIADVKQLDLSLSVNGEIRQQGNTRDMIFDVYFLVHYLSQFMRLEAGDIITTGTPAGVGLGMTPPQFLKAGDIVELNITGLGQQRNRVVANKN